MTSQSILILNEDAISGRGKLRLAAHAEIKLFRIALALAESFPFTVQSQTDTLDLKRSGHKIPILVVIQLRSQSSHYIRRKNEKIKQANNNDNNNNNINNNNNEETNKKRDNIFKHVALVVWKSSLFITNACNVTWLKHKRP